MPGIFIRRRATSASFAVVVWSVRAQRNVEPLYVGNRSSDNYGGDLCIASTAGKRSQAMPRPASPCASLNEIQILNSFGKQGWVFESPAQCPQIVQTPLNKVRLAIAVHTHLFSN